MLESVLKRLGLKDPEIKVYLTCLQLGTQAASVIARRVAMNRTTTYVILQALVRRGIISKYTKGNVTYFSAEEPDALLGYIDHKRQEFEALKEQVQEILPNLKTMHNLSGNLPRVRFFEGIDGIKSSYEEVLKLNPTSMVSYVAPATEKDHEIKEYNQRSYIKKRIAKGIPIRLIVPETAEGIELKKTDAQSIRETRIVPHAKFPFPPIEINIFPPFFHFVSYMKDSYVAGIIEDEPLSETQQVLFELAWNEAKRWDEEICRKNGIPVG